MYCNRCYAKLDPDDSSCPQCGAPFAASNPSSYSRKPFPSVPLIVFHVIGTTIVGVVAGFVIAFHQMAAMSGH
jgi:predicted amidophosphoribosyltransferase